MTNNSINVLMPYKWYGIWVFDDERTGLVREAFVAGIDLILDKLTEDVPDAQNGFNLIFSTNSFPGHSIHLEWQYLDEDNNGNWYYCPEYNLTGWLCPALYLYYPEAPQKIYIQAKSKQ